MEVLYITPMETMELIHERSKQLRVTVCEHYVDLTNGYHLSRLLMSAFLVFFLVFLHLVYTLH